jgi:hypothetical protein
MNNEQKLERLKSDFEQADERMRFHILNQNIDGAAAALSERDLKQQLIRRLEKRMAKA